MKYLIALSLIIATLETGFASNQHLAPFKDELFAYPRILERSAKSAFRVVEYNRERDMVDRDQILRRKAHFRYVDQSVRWSRSVYRYRSTNGRYKYFAVGDANRRTKLVVIYIHGQGGNHRQGVNDWTFGGNFNRLQNLMVNNRGLLMTPSFTDFKDRGAADITVLMRDAKIAAPNAQIVVACGSMGGGVCWRLIDNAKSAKMLDGLFLLGSHWDDGFLKSAAIKRKTRNIPIYIGHGSKDVVFKPSRQKSFFNQILKKNPNYPARFVMFESGAHGTPIRMIDWRAELNWMLSVR